jgi:DNA repair exonuclease SbcCD ATPase subunit
MVGVISHMKDLKQVIPAKMEVVKNAAGYSSAMITID